MEVLLLNCWVQNCRLTIMFFMNFGESDSMNEKHLASFKNKNQLLVILVGLCYLTASEE